MNSVPPKATLLPYTTLFRSLGVGALALGGGRGERVLDEAARGGRVAGCERGARARERVGGGERKSGARRSDGRRNARSDRSEEHTSELQSLRHLVCRLLLVK